MGPYARPTNRLSPSTAPTPTPAAMAMAYATTISRNVSNKLAGKSGYDSSVSSLASAGTTAEGGT